MSPIHPISINREKRFLLNQAYAELEENTPGQIMGITQKTDGKSADDGSTMSDKFTQRSKDRDSYSEHDPTDTVEYQKEQLGGSRLYFFIGVFFVALGIVYACSKPTMDLDYERELVYQKLEERERQRRIDEEAQLKSKLGPFRDA